MSFSLSFPATNLEACGLDVPNEILSEIVNAMDEIDAMANFSMVSKACWNAYTKTGIYAYISKLRIEDRIENRRTDHHRDRRHHAAVGTTSANGSPG